MLQQIHKLVRAGYLYGYQRCAIPEVTAVFLTLYSASLLVVHRDVCLILDELGLKDMALLFKGLECRGLGKLAPGKLHGYLLAPALSFQRPDPGRKM